METPTEGALSCSKLLDLLREPMENGCQVTLTIEGGVLWADLNTYAKSGCKLECRDAGIFAHRRYGELDKIETFRDLLNVVHGCGHGRSFFDESWERVLIDNGYESPRGTI